MKSGPNSRTIYFRLFQPAIVYSVTQALSATNLTVKELQRVLSAKQQPPEITGQIPIVNRADVFFDRVQQGRRQHAKTPVQLSWPAD